MPARQTSLPLLACLALLPSPPAPGATPPAGKAVRVDRYGDPLPPGALARLGTLRLHQTLPNCVAFRPDGKVLASGGSDNKVRFWDPRTGRQLRRLDGHDGDIACLAFSPDGRWLASGGDDRVIRLWEAATGKQVRRLRGHTHPIESVAFSPDGKLLASCCGGHTVRLWDVASGKERGRFGDSHPPGHLVYAAQTVAFAPDGKHLAAGDSRGKVYLWRVSPWKQVWEVQAHRGRTEGVAFLPDGKRLLSGGFDKVVLVRDAATGKELRRCEEAHDLIRSLALSPDGKSVAGGTVEGGLHVWDVATGKERLRWRAARAALTALAYSPDGKTLASVAPWSNRIDLWEAATGKHLLPAPGPPGAAQHLAFAADGRSLAVSYTPAALPGWDVRVWDTRAGEELSRAGGRGQRVTALLGSPDGRFLAAAMARGGAEVELWDVSARKALARRAGYADFTALCPAGGAVTWARGEGLVVWGGAGGKEGRFGKADSDPPRGLAVSPDGSRLAVADPRGVSLYALPGGRQLHALGAQPGQIAFVSFSPDGRVVVASGPGARHSEGGTTIDTGVYLWEAATGKECLRLLGHRHQVVAAAVSPDGRLLASAGAREGVRLWDLTTGKQVAKVGGHHGWVPALAFSPDGRTLATAGGDTTVLLWDVARVVPARKRPVGRLSGERLDALWKDLGSEDAAKAYRALWALADHPAQAVPFFRERLGAGLTARLRRVNRLIVDLDSEEFDVREKASRELAGLGRLAEPALREALRRRPSLEAVLRLKRLLRRLETEATPAEVLRLWRALGALDRAGTPEAARLRKALSNPLGE
jgi:WD40 repeat protein